MSDYSPTTNYPWTTESPSIDSDDEETQDRIGVPSGVGIRGYQTSHPEPYWDKRFLPLLYEDLSSVSTHYDVDMVTQLEVQPTNTITTPIYAEDKTTILHIFEWKVLNIGPKGGRTKQSEIDLLFSVTNFSNAYLWGANHNNRLRRGTKVYLVKGELDGEHGTVVGHVPGFSIHNNPRSVHYLIVLLSSGCAEAVRQDFVKLVDLHQQLPFGIPKPIVIKKRSMSGWGSGSNGWDTWKNSSN